MSPTNSPQGEQQPPANPPPEPDLPPPAEPGQPRDVGNSIGRYMIIGFWLLVVFLGYKWADRHLAWMENPNASPTSITVNGKASVQLAMNRQGHYVTTGTINLLPAVFLLDTGATSVSLPASMADELGLQRGQRVTVSTANGLTVGWRVRLDSVAIGALELRDVDALINSGQDDHEVLLGMSYLRHFKLVQQDRILTIEQY